MNSSSTLPHEISQFSALAEKWWDPNGPMAPLHAMNPARIGWLAQQAEHYFSKPFKDIQLLDLGCGAGIATEALGKLGFSVTGADASRQVLEVAKKRLEKTPSLQSKISYTQASGEELAEQKRKFEIVCAFEIIEHVRDPKAFLKTLSDLTAPKGIVIVSTLNRTYNAFFEAKILAEYVCRLLPVGTHDWRKFLRPSELAAMGRTAGLNPAQTCGLKFNSPYWTTKRDPGSNYIMLFQKPA